MRRFNALVLSSVIIFLIIIGCSPKIISTPAPVPQPAPAPVAQPAAPSTAASAEDAAWAKVIETAKKEGRLNVYGVTLTGDAGQAVSNSFGARYGVKLDIISGGGAALAERIKTEKRMGTIVADVMDANTFNISGIKDIGATISAEDLPALKEKGVWRVDPWANDPQKHKLIDAVLYNSIVANAALLKSSDEPRSVKELALPKWKGKMTAFDSRQSSNPYNYFLPLLKRGLIDLDTLQAIGKNDVAWTPTLIETAQNLIRGQYLLALPTGVSIFTTLVVENPTLPVKLLDMEEGVVMQNQAIALVKDGPHPNAAKLFVNWMLTSEGQTVFTGARGTASVRKDVPVFTPASLRISPTRLIVPSADEEEEHVKLFREGYLAKLWGK